MNIEHESIPLWSELWKSVPIATGSPHADDARDKGMRLEDPWSRLRIRTDSIDTLPPVRRSDDANGYIARPNVLKEDAFNALLAVRGSRGPFARAAQAAIDEYKRTPVTGRWSEAMAEERAVAAYLRIRNEIAIAKPRSRLRSHIDNIEQALAHRSMSRGPNTSITLTATTPITDWHTYAGRTRALLDENVASKSNGEMDAYAEDIHKRAGDIDAVAAAFAKTVAPKPSAWYSFASGTALRCFCPKVKGKGATSSRIAINEETRHIRVRA